MGSDKISWCKKQSKGVGLVEPNDNLSKSYFKDADDSFSSMQNVKGMWKTVMAYYSCYFSLYALLMKSGIKCEIHECTLALMKLFDFSLEEITFLRELKEERVKVQYYHQDPEEVVIDKVKQFILICKNKAKTLKSDDIEIIRGQVKND